MSERGTAAQVAAQAKINLFLRVLAREANGYHQIETLFLRIGLHDVVRVRHTPRERSLDVRGDVDLGALGPVEQNLAWRAAVAYADACEWRGGFAIEIEKHIPIGGGLGGGSADAAGVIRAMGALADAPLQWHLGLALGLGADVPFLASEAAYALAWGRGERMLALEPPPERDLVLIVPPFAVNTAEAYRWVDEDPAPPGRPGPLSHQFRIAELADWRALASVSGNTFEWYVGKRRPEFVVLFDRLAASGVEIAQMTGSGSTLFGVVREHADVEAVVDEFDQAGLRVIRTRTASHVEPVEIIE